MEHSNMIQSTAAQHSDTIKVTVFRTLQIVYCREYALVAQEFAIRDIEQYMPATHVISCSFDVRDAWDYACKFKSTSGRQVQLGWSETFVKIEYVKRTQ